MCKNPRFRGDPHSFRVQWNKLQYPEDYAENYYIEVPCGKCYLCRKKKANFWRVRLTEELKDTPRFYDYDGVNKYRVAFVTFTYDDAHLPTSERRDAVADHIRKWRDLWRKKYGKSPRYFATTDKGSQFGRLHLHLLIFNPFNYKLNKPLEECDMSFNNFMWRFGMARYKDSELWLESSRGVTYVTSYITGGNLEKDAKKHGKPICKEALEYVPWVFVSNGLGKGFIERSARYGQVLKPLYNLNGYDYALPSYYRYKLIPYELRWHSNLVYKYEKMQYVSENEVVYSYGGSFVSYDAVKRSYDEKFSQFDNVYKFKVPNYAKKHTY